MVDLFLTCESRRRGELASIVVATSHSQARDAFGGFVG